ncbi:hypothetical protein P5673_020151 [Acropora cervicornis]|uniref:Gustatory receptor n=1 Tax=Acropora cervicornis TaxID=6130 RepID=A0AAD9QAK3_ACRCE|nr:hypothetical protein P5673_020151 [Acropora cervicornis]
MSSQVTPKDSCIISICDSPSSISARTVTNEIALVERGQSNANANEEFLQAIAEIYKPVLRLLKLSGVYFGSTTFATTIYPSNQGKGNLLSRFYCGIVVVGLWFDFLMPVVSVFCGADIYLNIMNLGWCLLVALLGTTCLIVLPSTSTKASRFENFIRKVSSTEIEIPRLAKVVGFSIPVMCFNFYQLIHSQNVKDIAFVISVLFWLLSSATIMAAVLINGSRVNEKIHAVQKILQPLPIATEDEGKLLIFLMDLHGEPRGLSIGGLSVITKSLSITVVGVIISYAAVILSLPG